MGCGEEFVGLAKPIVWTQVSIDGEGVVDSLAIVNGGQFYLPDGSVNLSNGGVVVAAHWLPSPTIVEVVACCPQIAEGMEIGRMWAWNLLGLRRKWSTRRDPNKKES
jgi:hypothetical protein